HQHSPRSTLFPYTTLFRSKAHIWDIERGQSKNPSLELLKRIADFFEIGVGELVGENPNAEGEPEELIALYRGLKDLSAEDRETEDRKSTRLNSSHDQISYA